MDLRLRLLIIFVCVCAVFFFLDVIRKEKMTLRIALPWLFCIGVTILLAVFPNLIDAVAYILGIASPMNALFFCALVFLITIVFFCYLTANRSATRSVRLIQEIALLQDEIQQGIKKGDDDATR